LQSRAPRYLRGAVSMLAAIAVLFLIITYLYSQSWSGFVTIQGSSAGAESAKTLWDWMELLIIPLALAAIAFWFRKSEVESANQQTRERNRDEALNTYFGHIQTILLETDLSNEQDVDAASKLATARTISLLRTLDPERKLLLLRFLFDAELIQSTNPFITLTGADFSWIKAYRFYLDAANLHGVNLNHARLGSSKLNEAYLSGASLYKARLPSSELNRANLDYVLLDEADLYFAKLQEASLIKAQARKSNFAGAFLGGAILRDIDFTRANLRKAKLRKAYLVWATLVHANLTNADLSEANLTEANLMYANLKGADLTGANLTNAIVSQSQLRKAKSLSGATIVGIRERLGSPRMPDPDEILHQYSQKPTNVNQTTDSGIENNLPE